MALRDREGILAALRRDSQGLVVGRLRATIGLGLVGLLISIPFDFALERDRLWPLLYLKAGAALAYPAAILLLGALRHARWAIVAGTSAAAAGMLCVVTSAICLITGEQEVASYLLTVIVLGGSVVYPWGLRPQLGLVAIATVLFVGYAHVETGLANL
jgi:hypothetical protein